MKVLLFCVALILAVPAVGQYPDNPKIVTFNWSDAEHCKQFSFDGNKFLELDNGGTTVIVGVPANLGHGEFSMFVSISQTGPGSIEVIPSSFSGWFSDPIHTRFPQVDRDSEVNKETKRSHVLWGIVGAVTSGAGSTQQATVHNSDGTYSTITYPDPNAEARNQERARATEDRIQQQDAMKRQGILRQNTVIQGSYAAGMVFFKKPKDSKLHVGPKDTFFAVDIPLNGVVFRFQ